ncbi:MULTISPECIES: hypothetical protein [Streptomyces]|uniref:hypothetical protein n=1 Tax=Streptomyces TaxID=1883 RepID=UPI002E2D7588|nr:hypothetical protein [Streptomyces sp. NBC_00271]
MHVLLVPPVDNVDHPAVRHLTSAVGTALSGSVVSAFLGMGSARHVEPAGHELGDDALHGGTAGLLTWVGAAAAGPAALLAGPLH